MNDVRKLLTAARCGDVDAVAALLQAGLAPDVSHCYRRTPLFFAVLRGHLDVARLLLEHGADPNIETELGETLLGRAASFEMIRLLLDYGAQPTPAIASEWLVRPTTITEKESEFADATPDFSRTWSEFKRSIMPEDELWLFCSPQWSWEMLSGRSGLVIVKRGVPYRILVTHLS